MTYTVVVTRPRALRSMGAQVPADSPTSFTGVYLGADKLIEKVSQAGFRCIHLPVLATSLLPITPPLSEAIFRLGQKRYSWLVLLSPTAVYAFRDVWDEVCGETVFPSTTKVALQGPGTAEAFRKCFSRDPDLVPDVYLAEELGKKLSNHIISSGVDDQVHVLLLQARDGRNVVGPIIASSGAGVESLPLYATEEVPLDSEKRDCIWGIPEEELVLLFMSPSAVRATNKYLEERHKRSSFVLCVGPITAQAAKECGYRHIIESKEHSEEGIVALLRTTCGVS